MTGTMGSCLHTRGLLLPIIICPADLAAPSAGYLCSVDDEDDREIAENRIWQSCLDFTTYRVACSLAS